MSSKNRKKSGKVKNKCMKGGLDVLQGEEMANPLHEKEVGSPRRAGRPAMKRGEDALHLKIELDLGGKFTR